MGRKNLSSQICGNTYCVNYFGCVRSAPMVSMSPYCKAFLGSKAVGGFL